LLVEGDVGVPDAGLEIDSWRLEGVFGGESEEEFEFTALDECQWELNIYIRAQMTYHVW
jgi:hypothetical protein